jgi:hypothetical protein
VALVGVAELDYKIRTVQWMTAGGGGGRHKVLAFFTTFFATFSFPSPLFPHKASAGLAAVWLEVAVGIAVDARD